MHHEQCKPTKTQSQGTSRAASRHAVETDYLEVIAKGYNGDPAPPVGNTGALSTSPAPSFLLDWLSYTLPDGTAPEDACPFLDGVELVKWVELEHGYNGYQKARRWGHVTVNYSGAVPGMGVNVQLSGQGCREVEALGVTDWQGVLRLLSERKASFPRVDFALDDRAGLLDMGELVGAVEAGRYTSPSNRWSIDRSGHRKGEQHGVTIYIGSKQSDTQIRVYDKAAEQGLEDETWIRVELQLRDARADRAVALFSDPAGNGVASIVGVVRRYLDFKASTSGDSNRSRQATAGWWQKFLGDVQKVKLTVAPALPTVEEVRQWVHRQVAPSLALLVEAFGGDMRVLVEACNVGRERWSVRHRLILAGASAVT